MATGEYYEAIPGTPKLIEAFKSGSIPELPEWIPEIIDKALAERAAAHSSASEGGSGDGIERLTSFAGIDIEAVDRSGPMTDRRLRAIGLAALEGEANKLARIGVGGRNHALNVAAFTLGGHAATGRISEAEAYAALWGACQSNGYLSSNAAGDGARAFHRTFASGFKDGLRKPFPAPNDT
jgi:hypothetical protein